MDMPAEECTFMCKCMRLCEEFLCREGEEELIKLHAHSNHITLYSSELPYARVCMCIQPYEEVCARYCVRKRGWGWVDSLLIDCLMSQQHACASLGQICSDNCTCCHTEMEVADQTSTSPSHSMLTLGRSVPAETL